MRQTYTHKSEQRVYNTPLFPLISLSSPYFSFFSNFLLRETSEKMKKDQKNDREGKKTKKKEKKKTKVEEKSEEKHENYTAKLD